ncbi:hypothetical protein DPEC_G00079840 [Dallia pectoralis]|uniref:Uncharacterized protein n=1 Tax=Dallia pectoralis TaxID=75939 RepID=A0ACC2H530_DALPE|nr:hypothetical protein DPEC_G00079840 [Dallia pectoralis]
MNVSPGSCRDTVVLAAVEQAIDKLNKDRVEGYIFGLHRLRNVNQMEHGNVGMVFYLTMDVLETNCHVLSRKTTEACEIRSYADSPVYGQCKAVIYISPRPSVVHLYQYNCVVRPVSRQKVASFCPDCPTYMSVDNDKIQKTAALSVEKFNSKRSQANHFAVLQVTLAQASMAWGILYVVEFTIQETTCSSNTDSSTASLCRLMSCRLAHRGHCKGSFFKVRGSKETVNVNCEVFKRNPQVCSYRPLGTVTILPALGLPMTTPSTTPYVSHQPVGVQGTVNPGVFGMSPPVIVPFPTTVSVQCPAEVQAEDHFVRELFAEDSLFKTAA